jgi:hypothetical protein
MPVWLNFLDSRELYSYPGHIPSAVPLFLAVSSKQILWGSCPRILLWESILDI